MQGQLGRDIRWIRDGWTPTRSRPSGHTPRGSVGEDDHPGDGEDVHHHEDGDQEHGGTAGDGDDGDGPQLTAPELAFTVAGDPLGDIIQHLDHGWCYWGPSSFGLARIVDVRWSQEDLKCPEVYVDPQDDLTSEHLGWYFTRIAGDMAEVFSKLPFPLPHVGWHRHKGNTSPRLYRYDRLAQLLQPAECGFHTIQRRR